MPAFLTHYSCGVIGYRSMERGFLKSCIALHKGAYAMGLAGPDLFFYSIYELARPGMTIGRIMHKYRTGLFLRNLYEEAEKLAGQKKCAALAYFAGFVGHYSLDASCHPFIYLATNRGSESMSLGRHFRLEAALDAASCRKVLHRNIQHSGQMQMIRLSRLEKDVIARILSEACRKTYPDAQMPLGYRRMKLILDEYYLISGLLIDPSGFREWLMVNLEKRTIGYPLCSPLFINGSRYGLDRKLEDAFYLRFRQGCGYFSNLLEKLREAVDEEKGTEEFFDLLGSRSYHTGRSRDGSISTKEW